MAAALLASHFPMCFICIIRSTNIHWRPAGHWGHAMNAVNATPPSSRLSLPTVTWAGIIIPIMQMKKLLLREVRRPEDTKQHVEESVLRVPGRLPSRTCQPPPPKAPRTLLRNSADVKAHCGLLPCSLWGGVRCSKTMTERTPLPKVLHPHGTQPDSQPSCSGRTLLCVLLWVCRSRGAVFHSFLGRSLRVEDLLYE